MGARGLFLTCAVAIAVADSSVGQPVVWNNPATGGSAGQWNNGANWNPAVVPTSSNNAQIGNGGEAVVTGNVAASRIEVGKNDGVGILTSTVADVELIVDSDFDIGEIGGDYATGGISATGDGVVNIANAALLRIGDSGAGDLDLGQSNATAAAVASGQGTLSLQSILLVEIVDDADVGQAGGSATAVANGVFEANGIGTLQIGADLDVGQSGGSGSANATGSVDIVDSQVIVGADVDVGRTAASTAGNQGTGTLRIKNSSLSIGFKNQLTPGALNIGDASADVDKLAAAVGSVVVEGGSAQVADRINIAGLSGGGSNVQNTATGSLHVVDAVLSAATVEVAVVFDATAGVAEGELRTDASWVDISGPLTMGAGGTLHFGLSGTDRADANSSASAYGAIDADAATLGGELRLTLLDGFLPAAGNRFELLATTGSISGTISPVDLPSLSSGLSWEIVQTADSLSAVVVGGVASADFDADFDIDGRDFLTWQMGFPVAADATVEQGDADGDGTVAGADLDVWQGQWGMATNQTQVVRGVPEPPTVSLAVLMVGSFSVVVRRGRFRL